MIDHTGAVPVDVNRVHLDTSGARHPFGASEAVMSTGTYDADGQHSSVILVKGLNGGVTTAVAATLAVDGSVGVLQTVPKK